MKLKHVQRCNIHPFPRNINVLFDKAAGHLHWGWHPFGKTSDSFQIFWGSLSAYFVDEDAIKIFCRSILVGHVESGETGVGVIEHSLNGVVSVDSAPATASLPHTVQDSTYIQRIIAVLQCHRPVLLLHRRRAAPHNRRSSRLLPSTSPPPQPAICRAVQGEVIGRKIGN
nr:hypothetical protein Iba_scaffold389764CG0020 [Ipomoea batatas]